MQFERPLIISAVSFVLFAGFHIVAFKWVALLTLIIGVRRFFRARSITPSVTTVTTTGVESEEKNKLQALKRALTKTQFEDLTEKYSSQALEQLQHHQERMTSFERTLSLKLNPTEITYARYHDAAKEVSNTVLNQLNEIATRLSNVISIKSSGDLTQNSEEAKRALLREQDLAKVSAALVQNELALTKMDELTQAISEMKSLSGTTHDLAPLLSELEELAQRAKKY